MKRLHIPSAVKTVS